MADRLDMRHTKEALIAQAMTVSVAKSFPLGDIIEKTLLERNVPYRVADFWGGLDTRVCKRYEVHLPADQVPAWGIFGLMGFTGTKPAITLPDLCSQITERYREAEPGFPRPEPSVVTERFARYYPRTPAGEGSDHAYIDVAELKVVGYVPALKEDRLGTAKLYEHFPNAK